MKQTARFIPAVIGLLLYVFTPSCFKVSDVVRLHPGAEINVCRILTMSNGSDTFTVRYNQFGDPSDVVSKRHSWQGDWFFRYDKYHRLTDYYWGIAGNAYRLIWHRYSYPAKSIVHDSLFDYITDGSGPNPPMQNLSSVNRDSLDAEGRIVKVTPLELPGQPGNVGSPYYFTYNAHGNLDYSYATYDNKLSIYHTSRVWMFIVNDYSVNNRTNVNFYYPVAITSYNPVGLPLVFQVTTPDGTGDLFNAISYRTMRVTYGCEEGAARKD